MNKKKALRRKRIVVSIMLFAMIFSFIAGLITI